jgi:peptide/nickel transport system permease protein
MFGYILSRIVGGIAVVTAVSIVVYVAVFLIGDPVLIFVGPDADAETVARARAELGLDRSLLDQYVRFASRALHGDFGKSFVFDFPALQLITSKLPATLELAAAATLIALTVGLPLGLWAGLRERSVPAHTIMVGSVLGISVPSFWVGTMLILIFAVVLGWLPSGGRGPETVVLGFPTTLMSLEGLRHIALPAMNLSLFPMALVIRLAESGVREAMQSDYVLFARAKGLSPRRIIGVHVLRNLMIPIVTLLGLELGAMLAFATVTETVFNWPGMGKLIIDSMITLDRPVIVAYLILVVVIFVVVNLLVDLLYAALDPRIRLVEAR